MHQVIESASAIAGSRFRDDLPRQGLPRGVLMVAPDHFDVVYAINPHMVDASGRLQHVDKERARASWDALRRTYEALGYPVAVLPGEPGLPDMVFAANQALAVPDAGGRGWRALLSRMRHPQRVPEVAFFRRWFESEGIPTLELPEGTGGFLEGHGDALWLPGRRLLLMGHGYRTERATLDALAPFLDVPIAALRLADERFYHLDTCLVPVDDERAFAVGEAFDEEGWALLRAVFRELVEIPRDEAVRRFAGNAHCPDGRNVVIDSGCEATAALLEAEGLRVHGVDTTEFLKSGGSVFCLKLMLPEAPGTGPVPRPPSPAA